MKELATRLEKVHADVFATLVDLREKIATSQMEFKDLADIGYYLKWISEMMDDLRKESNKVSELAQKVACLTWIKAPVRPERVVADEYTATPDVSYSANVPSRSKDPEAYDEFMQWLGVPDKLVEQELVRVHWPTLSKVITELVERGEALPPGIDPSKQHTHYKLNYRAKKRLK